MGIPISDYHAMLARLEKFSKPTPGAVALKPHTTNAAPGVRIRQDSKPLLNKLETEWFNILQCTGSVISLKAQAMRFKLANGAWYKPDMTGWLNGQLTAWECKGPSCMKNVDRGILTVKIAAHEWTDVAFFLIWKESGGFAQQRVLP